MIPSGRIERVARGSWVVTNENDSTRVLCEHGNDGVLKRLVVGVEELLATLRDVTWELGSEGQVLSRDSGCRLCCARAVVDVERDEAEVDDVLDGPGEQHLLRARGCL